MLTIRLQRTGKKNQADFRIVLAEKESPVNKKIVEILGSYNPRKKNFQVKEERTKYWIAQRVEMSETIHNLFISKNLVSGPKVKAFSIPKKKVESEAAKPVETAPAEASPSATEIPAADKPAIAEPSPAEVSAPAAEEKPPAA
jgi:small subunit ribosomal protein S16